MEVLGKGVKRRRTYIRTLFRTPIMKHLSIVTPFIFFFISTAYYGLTFRKISMYGYVDTLDVLMIKGGLEILATTVAILLPYSSELVNLVIITFVEGILCLGSALWPSKSTPAVILFMTSRFFASVVNTSLASTIVTYYPTMIRVTGLGWGYTSVGLALLFATNVVNLGRWAENLPPVIFGASACIGSVLLLLMPPDICATGVTDFVQQLEDDYALEAAKIHDKEASDALKKLKPIHFTRIHLKKWKKMMKSGRKDKSQKVTMKPSISLLLDGSLDQESLDIRDSSSSWTDSAIMGFSDESDEKSKSSSTQEMDEESNDKN